MIIAETNVTSASGILCQTSDVFLSSIFIKYQLSDLSAHIPQFLFNTLILSYFIAAGLQHNCKF